MFGELHLTQLDSKNYSLTIIDSYSYITKRIVYLTSNFVIFLTESDQRNLALYIINVNS